MDPLFADLPTTFAVGRYHSWVVRHDRLPSCLTISAVDDDGEIMALRHRTLPVWGIQFHPESVLTERGEQIATNWLNTIQEAA